MLNWNVQKENYAKHYCYKGRSGVILQRYFSLNSVSVRCIFYYFLLLQN